MRMLITRGSKTAQSCWSHECISMIYRIPGILQILRMSDMVDKSGSPFSTPTNEVKSKYWCSFELSWLICMMTCLLVIHGRPRPMRYVSVSDDINYHIKFFFLVQLKRAAKLFVSASVIRIGSGSFKEISLQSTCLRLCPLLLPTPPPSSSQVSLVNFLSLYKSKWLFAIILDDWESGIHPYLHQSSYKNTFDLGPSMTEYDCAVLQLTFVFLCFPWLTKLVCILLSINLDQPYPLG